MVLFFNLEMSTKNMWGTGSMRFEKGTSGTLIGVTVFCLTASAGAAEAVTGQDVLEGLEVSEQNRRALEAGEVLTFDGEAYEGSARDLAADAMVLIERPLNDVLQEVKQVGSVIPLKYLVEFKDISSHDDFADIAYTETEIKEVDRLLRARPGKKLNLNDKEIAILRQAGKQATGKNTVDRVRIASDAMRDILIGRYEAYRASGLEGVAGYVRSKRKTIDIGRELTAFTETFEPFEPEFPSYYRVMRHFPAGADCCEHLFRWMKVDLNKRPAFALSHTFIEKTEDKLLVTERHYYVTHSVNSLQVTISWLPYDEDTYMSLAVTANTDVLESALGRVFRGIGRSKARELLTEVLVDFRDDTYVASEAEERR